MKKMNEMVELVFGVKEAVERHGGTVAAQTMAAPGYMAVTITTPDHGNLFLLLVEREKRHWEAHVSYFSHGDIPTSWHEVQCGYPDEVLFALEEHFAVELHHGEDCT